MGQRVVGSLLGMGPQGSWRIGGVADLRRLSTRANLTRLDRSSGCLLRSSSVSSDHLYLSRRQLSAAGYALVRMTVGVSLRGHPPFVLIVTSDFGEGGAHTEGHPYK